MTATARRTSGFPKKVGAWNLHDRTIPYVNDRDVMYQSTWSRLCGDITARRSVVVRVRIRRNEIDCQSYAVLEVLNRETVAWSILVALGPKNMAVHAEGPNRTKLVSTSIMMNRYGSTMTEADQFAIWDAFVADEENLLGQAASLIDAAL